MKLAALLPLALFAATLHAADKKIDRSALPAAVEKTVQANTSGATIRGFSTESEGGKRVYEAETLLNGHTRDLEIAADGTLNAIEEEVSLDTLPPAVQHALKAKAGTAKLVKIESIVKKNKLVAYEAATLNGTKKGEIQVGPNGESLKHEQ